MINKHGKINFPDEVSTKDSRKVMPLFSVNIYPQTMKIANYYECCFESMLNFSTKSPSTSTALRRLGTRLCMPCQYHALSCLRSQVLNGRITSSSVINFGLRPSGLQIGGNLGVLDRSCRKDGVTLSTHIF